MIEHGRVHFMSKKELVYHGWVCVEKDGPASNDSVWAEWHEPDGTLTRSEIFYGASGAVQALEFWDKRVGKPIKLLATPTAPCRSAGRPQAHKGAQAASDRVDRSLCVCG